MIKAKQLAAQEALRQRQRAAAANIRARGAGLGAARAKRTATPARRSRSPAHKSPARRSRSPATPKQLKTIMRQLQRQASPIRLTKALLGTPSPIAQMRSLQRLQLLQRQNQAQRALLLGRAALRGDADFDSFARVPAAAAAAAAAAGAAVPVAAKVEKTLALSVEAAHERQVQQWREQARQAKRTGAVLTQRILRVDYEALSKAMGGKGVQDTGIATVLAGKLSKSKLLALAAPGTTQKRASLLKLYGGATITGLGLGTLARSWMGQDKPLVEYAGNMLSSAAQTVKDAVKGLASGVAQRLGWGAADGAATDAVAVYAPPAKTLFEKLSEWQSASWTPLLVGGLALAAVGGLGWMKWRSYKALNDTPAPAGPVPRDEDFWVQLNTLAHSQHEALYELGLLFDYDSGTFKALTEAQLAQVRARLSPQARAVLTPLAIMRNLALMRELQSGAKPVFTASTQQCTIVDSAQAVQLPLSAGGRFKRGTARSRSRRRGRSGQSRGMTSARRSRPRKHRRSASRR